MITIHPTTWLIGTGLAGAILTALILAITHWFPWPRELKRTEAYTIGCIAILIGFALWRLLNGDWITPLGLLIIIVAGGGATLAAYHIDRTILSDRQVKRAERHDPTLSA